MAGDKEDTTAGRVATAVPARRGYAISRIDAPPKAAPASSPPLNVAAARADSSNSSRNRGGYKPPPSDNKQQHKGGAGQGGDGGGVEGGRGRRKRGGKGRKTPSAAASAAVAVADSSAAGVGNAKGADDPIGGLDHKHGPPRPVHHNQPQQPQQQHYPRVHQDPARGEDAFLEGHRATTDPAARSGGLGRRGQYHHEHDDREEPPPPPAGRKSTTTTNSRHSSSIFENGANPSKPGTDHNKPSNARGRGSFTGDGNDRGGEGIFSRLGPPTISRGMGTGGRTAHNPKDYANNNSGGGGGGMSSRLGSPPRSPRNALSMVDGSGERHSKEKGRGAHRPPEKTKTTATTRTVPGATSSRGLRGAAGRVPPRTAVRESSPRPPREPAATSSNSTKKEHQLQQREAASSAATAVNGGSNGAPISSSRAVNHADRVISAGRRGDDAADDRGGPGRRNTAAAAAATVRTTTASKARKKQQQSEQQKRQHQQAQNQLSQQQSQEEYARGTCMSMCPDSERREREAEGGLSSFEATEATAKAAVPFRQRIADPDKTVKKYRRSAAGRDMHNPQHLRPLEVLQKTACYLVEDVFARACSSTSIGDGSGTSRDQQRGGSPSSNIAKAYVFVEDRLRAVRQDLTVQGLVLAPTVGVAEVLKTTANFYIVSGYLLCDEPSNVFDRHLHARELQGVFSSLAELFFQARGLVLPHQMTLGADEYLCLQAVHALTTAVSNSSRGGDMPLGEAAGGQGVARLFTTTVSKLCSGSSSTPLGRSPDHTGGNDVLASGVQAAAEGGVGSPLPFRTTFPKMAMAVRLLGVVGAGNWSEFFRVLGRLVSKADDGGDESESVLPLVADESACSPFAVRLRCLCHGMLLPVRAHALRAANKAYGKSEAVPLADVARLLRTRDEEHAAGICRALSLPVEDDRRNNDQPADQSMDRIGRPVARIDRRTVTFKSVAAAWASEKARATGYCAPPPRQQPSSQASPVSSTESGSGSAAGSGLGDNRGCRREDDWVGLTRALAAIVPEKKPSSQDANKTCSACAGFGCSWCDNGVVPAEQEGGGGEEGLWEAALCPT